MASSLSFTDLFHVFWNNINFWHPHCLDEINSILLILAVVHCAPSQLIIWFDGSYFPYHEKQRTTVFCSCFLRSWDFTDLSWLSLFLAEEKRHILLNPSFHGSFPDPLSPSSPFYESFSILPQHFWGVEMRTVPCSQDRAALWAQSHIIRLFLFHCAFPCNSYSQSLSYLV